MHDFPAYEVSVVRQKRIRILCGKTSLIAFIAPKKGEIINNFESVGLNLDF